MDPPPSLRPLPSARTLGAALLIAAGYWAGARFGVALKFGQQPISPLWPPNAILLAGLLLLPVRAWWLAVLATLPARFLVAIGTDVPPLMVFGWFVTNATEALIGAAIVRRFVGDAPLRFDRIRTGLVFVLGAGILAVALSSFLDAGLVTLLQMGGRPYWAVWRLRFLSNFLATLTIVPVIVTAWHGGRPAFRLVWRERRLEAAALAAAVLAVSVAVFAARYAGPDAAAFLPYVPLPLLFWAALRFGPGGTGAAVLTVALVAIWSAVHGLGPFAGRAPERQAIALQLFLVFTGVPLLLLAIVLEERKRAEEAVRRGAQRMALAAAVVDLGFFGAEVASVRRWVTDHTRRILGLPADLDVTERTFADQIHPEDRDEVMEARVATMVGGARFDREYRIVRPDGSVRWVHTIARVVDPAGDEILGVLIDVTDQRQSQLEFREQQRHLAHLARLAVVGELSGAIAHELKQPLTAILANAQVGIRLLGATTPLDRQELEEILLDVAADGTRAGAILDRIRRLMRDEPLVVAPLGVADLAREVLELTRGELLARGVAGHVAVDLHLPQVLGDRVQLQQVLINLVVNACDAMSLAAADRPRHLTIAASVELAGFVRLSIRDTGPGIPLASTERIFEPFVSAKAGGLGLGLSICRRIVAAHGGRLWAENHPAGGATFHVVLPTVEPAPPADATASPYRSVGFPDPARGAPAPA